MGHLYGNINNWCCKTTTYKETNAESEIFLGTIIKQIVSSSSDTSYECEHAGKKITHDGLIIPIKWQNALFNEWKERWLPKCNLDIVLCVDCSRSMAGSFENIKKFAIDIYPKLCSIYSNQLKKELWRLRIKVIAFRDYCADGSEGMHETKFYSIPDEESEFKTYINGLTPDGGCNRTENGLEAVALAMNSKWVRSGDKRHHIIIVLSNASAYALEDPKTKNKFYPQGMPANFDDLTDWWEDGQNGKMEKGAKRLLICAPDVSPWREMGMNFANAIHFPIKGGEDINFNALYFHVVNEI